MRRIPTCLALLLPCLCANALAGPPPKAVIDAIPDEAGLAIVAPNLERLVTGLSQFGRAIGSEELARLTVKQMMEDLLERLDGFDTTGTFALGINPDAPADSFLLCPLKDVDAWKKANSVQAGEGARAGLLQFSMQGRDCCALLKDDVIVLSHDAESLLDARKSKGRMAELLKPHAEMLEKNQLIVGIDVPRWETTVRGSLDMVQTMMQVGMAQTPDAKVAEGGAAMMKWVTVKVRELVEESKSLALGLSFGDEGVRVSNIWTVKPGGSAAEYLGKAKKTEGSLLRGLPDEPFVFATGFDWEIPPGTVSLSEQMLRLMVESAKDVDKTKLADVTRKAEELYRMMTGAGFMMHWAAEGGLVFSGVYHVKDGRAAAKLAADLAESSTAFMSAFSGGISGETKRSTEKIADRDVDIFELNFTTSNPEMTRAVQAMYGNPATMIIAGRESDSIFVMGPRAAARQRAEMLLGSKSSGLSSEKRITAALAQLPSDPQVFLAVDILRIAEMGLKMAEKMGKTLPDIKLPQQPQPLCVTAIYLKPEAIRAEVIVPAAPIRAIQKVMESEAGEGPKE